MNEAVPDASVIAKWFLPHEAGAAKARELLHAFVSGALVLSAPEHLQVEVIRILQLGVRDKHLDVEQGIRSVDEFLATEITYVSNGTLFKEAFRLASHYYMALYDALYLALAHGLDVPFITADRRFFNLAQRRGITSVVWYEDVEPSG